MKEFVKGHKLIMDGGLGALSTIKWRCECGKWESATPNVGPYGRTTAKARIAQVEMAHGKHAKYAPPPEIKQIGIDA